MPKPKESDEDIAVRSVLMRLYHSRQLGEAFYPAQFVNGHAPQMEADGWIERCGDGWRLTELGVQTWSEMNRSILRYKFQFGQRIFDEMRRVLKGEDLMANTICVVEGCGKQRMVTSKGERLTMCEDHQREYWRKTAKRKFDKNKVVNAAPTKIAEANLVSDTVIQDAELITVEVKSVQHDCETCYAKGVIEALKAKSPKLAKLIDAMEAEQKAAFELGL